MGQEFDGVNLRSGQAYAALQEFTRLNRPPVYGVATPVQQKKIKRGKWLTGQARLNAAELPCRRQDLTGQAPVQASGRYGRGVFHETIDVTQLSLPLVTPIRNQKAALTSDQNFVIQCMTKSARGVISMTRTRKSEKRAERINFRVSADKNELIKAAAQLKNISASQYVAESAAKQAEIDLADQQFFPLSEKQMEVFREALDRPVQEKSRLRQLFQEKTILDRENE